MPILSRFADNLRQIVAGGSICLGDLPVLDEPYVLDDLQSLDIPLREVKLLEHKGQVNPEKIEALPQDVTARQELAGYDPQPVTDFAHEHLGIAFMSTDVMTGD